MDDYIFKVGLVLSAVLYDIKVWKETDFLINSVPNKNTSLSHKTKTRQHRTKVVKKMQYHYSNTHVSASAILASRLFYFTTGIKSFAERNTSEPSQYKRVKYKAVKYIQGS